jgi:Fe-S-cluster containining protein
MSFARRVRRRRKARELEGADVVAESITAGHPGAARLLADYVAEKTASGELTEFGHVANPPAVPPIRPGNVRDAHRAFDVAVTAIVRATRERAHVPCTAGCDACCYDVAWTIELEARELALRVRSMPVRRRAAVLEVLAAWFAGMRAAGLDPNDNRPDVATYARARLACPLLDPEAHRCMLYDLRPLSCRGHYVIAPDATGCANRATNPIVRTLFMDLQMGVTVAQLAPAEAFAGELREELLPVALARELEALGLTA